VAERLVLVTGCSSGIGMELALALRSRGWRVFAGLRDPQRAPRALQGMEALPLDLSQPAQIVRAASGFERLDCLINNAGYALTGPFASYTAEQMQRQLQVNLLGPALLTQQLLPALRRAGGRVINVSSIAGEAGMPMNAMYCAAKHALEGWSESLRHELAGHGVQVALVEPGGFRTRFADNMEWGARPIEPDGEDARQLERYRAMRKRMLERPGRRPAPVVQAIARLAQMNTMPLRTRVGADACLLYGIKRWLPQALAVRLMGAAFRRRLTASESR
jgi:NAD(P)-dependent dehydrogenase (short-subunit alcohol dehydrogenase family)